MLTYHHNFSTRIFLGGGSHYSSSRQRVILGGAKDPAGRPASDWLLRSAQNDRERRPSPDRADSKANKGDAYAH